MRIDLDLNLLPILEALITEESVSGAADRLGISQSAASHALRRMRAYFKDALFVRSRNKMLPTPLVQRMEAVVRSTMEDVRYQIASSTLFHPSTSERKFTISTTDIGEVFLGMTIINELRKRAPHCRIKMISLGPRDTYAALERGDVDLSIGALKLEQDTLYQQLLCDERLVYIASRTHYGETPPFNDAQSFSRAPHISISPFGSDRDTLEWAFAAHRIKRNFVCELRSFLAIPFLVAESDLVATVPTFLARRFSNLTALISGPLPFASPVYPIRQAWHERYHSDSANLWLRQSVFSIFHGTR